MLPQDEAPDETRPRNVWPRLLMFGGLVLAALVAAGACLALYAASVPARDLRVSADALEPGLPRLLPVTSWGPDRNGYTYGAWVLLPQDGTGPRAFLSLDPSSGCHVRWDRAFVDPCNGSRYDRAGVLVEGPGHRDLDRFPVRIEDGVVIVPVSQVELGGCAAATAEDCSRPGEPAYRDLPAADLGRAGGLR
jgi:hypothetical protein